VRIISKYKDYYDSAQGYGIDTTLVYERTEREVKHPPVKGRTDNVWMIPRRFDLPGKKFKWEAECIVVGFCGQLYPCIIARTWYTYPEVPPTYVFYDHAMYEEFLERFSVSSNRFGGDRLTDFFTTFSEKSDKWFLEYNAPIFVVTCPHYDRVPIVHINCALEEYQFYRIKDAYTAFQDISTYLGNVLVGPKDILTIEDKYKIEQHGFDKFSFRHPTKLKDLK
jgi:hypothetical protein